MNPKRFKDLLNLTDFFGKIENFQNSNNERRLGGGGLKSNTIKLYLSMKLKKTIILLDILNNLL